MSARICKYCHTLIHSSMGDTCPICNRKSKGSTDSLEGDDKLIHSIITKIEEKFLRKMKHNNKITENTIRDLIVKVLQNRDKEIKWQPQEINITDKIIEYIFTIEWEEKERRIMIQGDRTNNNLAVFIIPEIG